MFFIVLNNQTITFLFLTLDEFYLNIFGLFSDAVGVSERAVSDCKKTSVYVAGKREFFLAGKDSRGDHGQGS